MEYTLEHQDDELRDRIRKGFEINTDPRSKKIDNRPKTPHHSNREKRTVSISKNVTEICDENVEKKPVVRKVKTKTEVAGAMQNLTLKQTESTKTLEKTTDKKQTGLYLCPKCDKTYKSKNGIINHMEKCM